MATRATMGTLISRPPMTTKLLSKPPYGPPLYWHQVSSGPQPCFSPAAEPTRSQDWMGWNNPLSTTPWPQVIFFS